MNGTNLSIGTTVINPAILGNKQVTENKVSETKTEVTSTPEKTEKEAPKKERKVKTQAEKETAKKEKEAKKQAAKDEKNKDAAKKTAPKKDTKKGKKEVTTTKAVTPKTSANPMIKAKKEAFKSLRAAGSQQKTISGAIKTIVTFWKDGYKDAFALLKMDYNQINFLKIKELWAKALISKDGVFMYRAKEAICDVDPKTKEPKKDNEGKKIYILDANGKKTYRVVLREFKNNFTPVKIFEALLEGAIERGEIVL